MNFAVFLEYPLLFAVSKSHLEGGFIRSAQALYHADRID